MPEGRGFTATLGKVTAAAMTMNKTEGSSTNRNDALEIKANTRENLPIKKDAYGLGVGMDQYGRAVNIAPAYPGNSGNYGKKPDAYDLTIHMDQYCRPVHIVLQQ
jgi:hypothetical protein